MIRRTSRHAATWLVLGGAIVSSTVLAQQALERVEITGSSIRRVDAEGALPVQVLKREDIEKTGAANVRDLIQLLPAMQGFLTASESVNGGNAGTATASLRNLGSEYTLVLLNGRRVAPYDNGSTVNLEQLPLSAVERVEILTDGASALYGADAVAGVVNFITKSNSQSGDIDIRYAAPQRAGGQSRNFSIGKGIGDIDADGFNVFGSLAYDKEARILARQRSWSRSGVRPFKSGGRDLYLWSLSFFSNPPNVELYDTSDEFITYFNPFVVRDGACPAGASRFTEDGVNCAFDYASMADLLPETERKSGFVSGQLKLTDRIRLFGEALISQSTQRAGYAPPADAIVEGAGASGLYNTYVAPYLTALGVDPGEVGTAIYYTRFEDTGQRRDEYKNKARHYVLGGNAQFGSFDYTASYTKSSSDLSDLNIGGYSSRLALESLIESGEFDPFDQGSAASRAAAASAALRAYAFKRQSDLDVINLRASGPVFAIGGREAYVGFGAEFTRQRFSDRPDPIYQGPNALQPDYADEPIGSTAGQPLFDAERKSRGVFAELVLPLLKELELTGALRYDDYDAPRDSFNLAPDGSLLGPARKGNNASESTYKLSLRYQPSREWLFRGSIGTGFRAPTLGDIVEPLADFGVIGTRRPCPVGSGDPLYAGCRTTPTQYRQFRGGNALTGDAGLAPETSDQWTVGLRFEPTSNFGIGLDYWSVKIKDAITLIPEDTAFDNFALYRELFTLTTDPDTGLPILTFNQTRVNSAERVSKGVDWDVVLRGHFQDARITTRFIGTYLIDSYFDLGFGNGKESSIGKMGSDDQVAFRVLTRLSTTVETGKFANTLTWSWRPGYKDQTYSADDYTIREQLPDGSPGDIVGVGDHRVSSYSLFDWQTVYAHDKAMSLTFGIKNLFDKKPPFTIKTVGGNHVGVDPRYHDVIGRLFYLNLKASF